MTNNFASIHLRASVLWFGMVAAILSFFVALVISRWLEGPISAVFTLVVVLATTFSSILFWWLFVVRPEHVSVSRGAEAGMVSIIAASFLVCWLFEAYSAVYYGTVIQLQDRGAFLIATVLVISILFWRFFTVLPERASLLRGVLAGIMSIIIAPFLVLCFYETYHVAYVVVIQHQPAIGALLNIGGILLLFLAYPLFTVLFVISVLGWFFFPIGAGAGGLLAWYLRKIMVSEAKLEEGQQTR